MFGHFFAMGAEVDKLFLIERWAAKPLCYQSKLRILSRSIDQ